MTDRFKGDEAGTFFIACIGLTLVTWRISFTLGAYGEVFYTDFITIWLVSLAALAAGMVIERTEDNVRYLTWWGSVLLLLPSTMMTATFWAPDVTALQGVLPLLLLPSIPYIAYILLSVAVPEAIELHNRRLLLRLIVIVFSVNVVSFLVGIFNYVFMSCDDFALAGDLPPKNCWSAAPN